jgi:hypothetical protein
MVSSDLNKLPTETYITNTKLDKVSKTLETGLLEHINNVKQFLNNSVDPNMIKMIAYYNIAYKYKPRVWISSQFQHGLFPKLSKLDPLIINDIMGQKITDNGEPDSINIHKVITDPSTHGYSFNIFNDPRERSWLIVNTEFKKAYTFFFIASKVEASDQGYFFTSSLPGRMLGWSGNDRMFKIGTLENSKLNVINGTDINLFILRCDNGTCTFVDQTQNPGIANLYTEEDWGKIVIGKPIATGSPDDLGRGILYEIMAYNKPLSDDQIDTIKSFFMNYYELKNTSANNNNKVWTPKTVVSKNY